MTAPPTPLNPDKLAALEEEREFLLRSLDDLDAEHRAGDIDDSDFEALKDDYTRRAAEVIRSIEHQQAATGTSSWRWGQALVWLVGLALLGGVAGLLIARSSGARTDAETISGDVRQSEVTRLNQAQSLFGDRDSWDDAIEIYDDVLQDSPSNLEALTYRAWLTYRQDSDVDSAVAAFSEVARLDDAYPDAVVFHTVVLTDAQRYSEAAEVLRSLDVASAPPEIVAIVTQRDVAGEVYGELVYASVVATPEPQLVDLGLSVDEALSAAAYVFNSDKEQRSIVALKLYRAVQVVDPDNSAALSREAWLLFQTFDPALVDTAIVLVDRAVAANPSSSEARFTRASILVSSDVEAACADLVLVIADPDADTGFVSESESLAAAFCS